MFEVNLVPDITRQLLQARSLRAKIISICLLAVGVGGGILVVLGAVATTQAVTSAQRDQDMKDGYTKFMASDNINASLTIQNQLLRLQDVYAGKKEVSRIFPVMDAILPTEDNRVMLASMNINFSSNVIYIEGQAQSATLNDYVALQAFEQTILRTTFDYGRYYDDKGEVIPTVDITEVVENGSLYGMYRQEECKDVKQEDGTTKRVCTPGEPIKIKRYGTKSGENPNKNGYVFESECGAYETLSAAGAKHVESSCYISKNGIQVTDRTSGRNTTSNDVVLRFDGKLELDERVFAFTSKHIFVQAPNRQIVTDSYDQIRDMFAEKAKDCAPEDTECMNSNQGGQ
jgi:hypothetical protein